MGDHVTETIKDLAMVIVAMVGCGAVGGLVVAILT